MNSQAMNPELTVLQDAKDPALHNVYYSSARYKIGEIRVRYTPQAGYDAYRNGTLIFEGAATLERAAQALADYSTRAAW